MTDNGEVHVNNAAEESSCPAYSESVADKTTVAPHNVDLQVLDPDKVVAPKVNI